MTYFISKKLSRGLRGGVLAMVAGLALSACGEDFFDVKNPGQILDADLNSARGVSALVVGMSAAFSEGYDGQAFLVARATDEMAGSGSYNSTAFFRRGILEAEEVDGWWEDAQEARWVAEAGLLRMSEIEGYTFEGNPLTARAYLLAGFSNRWLGENFCEVAFSSPYEGDTGEALPKSAAFQRGLDHFVEAKRQSDLAGTNDVATAAVGGQAQMQANLGNWSAAANLASQVATDFVYEAIFSANSTSERNEIYNETHLRNEMSAFGTLAGSYILDEAVAAAGGIPEDPRAPFTNCFVPGACSTPVGADGLTPHLRQDKYDDRGSNIPLVTGTEMRIIEAEAVLNTTQDIPTFLGFINEARAHYGIDPIDAADVTGVGSVRDGDDMDAWSILDRERHLTVWLEGRRLWDLDRWNHPFIEGGRVIYEPVNPRARCVPISFSECQTNPAIPCSVGG